jgi:Tol biopolymer transport system component
VGETYNLWTIKANGGEEKQLTTGGLPSVEFDILPYNRTHVSNFSWSPDGKNIAYISKSGGQRNIWLVAADGTSHAQLTNNIDSNSFVYCPIWSSDGKRIAYSLKLHKGSGEGEKNLTASVINLETKNTKIVVQTETFQQLLGWSQSNKELIVAVAKEKSGTGLLRDISIIQADIETGEQRRTAVLEAAYLYNIYLSPDKKMIAYTSNKDGKDNVWVARLSGGETRKITSNNDARLYFSALSWSPDNQTIYYGKQTRYSLLSMVTNFK